MQYERGGARSPAGPSFRTALCVVGMPPVYVDLERAERAERGEPLSLFLPGADLARAQFDCFCVQIYYMKNTV